MFTIRVLVWSNSVRLADCYSCCPCFGFYVCLCVVCLKGIFHWSITKLELSWTRLLDELKYSTSTFAPVSTDWRNWIIIIFVPLKPKDGSGSVSRRWKVLTRGLVKFLLAREPTTNMLLYKVLLLFGSACELGNLLPTTRLSPMCMCRRQMFCCKEQSSVWFGTCAEPVDFVQ